MGREGAVDERDKVNIEYQSVCPFVGIGTLACEGGSGGTEQKAWYSVILCGGALSLDSNCFYLLS
jgi:hypothetical protein